MPCEILPSAFPAKTGRPKKGQRKVKLRRINFELPADFIENFVAVAKIHGLSSQRAVRLALQEWRDRMITQRAEYAAETQDPYSDDGEEW